MGFEAAFRMTKVNMTWLRDQERGMEEMKKLSKDTLVNLL